MNTLDYYQNLRRLVSSSVRDNISEIEDNLKNLFEDISAYSYFNGDRETSVERKRMVAKADLSVQQPIVLHLNEEGVLVASCQPVLLSILSIKEIRMLFKMDRGIFHPNYLLYSAKEGRNPAEYLDKREYRQSLLDELSISISRLFGKNHSRDYRELSERPGDFFDQAQAVLKHAPVLPQGEGTLSLLDSLSISEALNHVSKEAIYNFASYRVDSLPLSFERGNGSWAAVCKIAKPKQIIPKWVKLLIRFSGRRTTEVKKTKTRLNRLQPLRFDLPGEIKSRKPEVICAVDTSGSRSNEDIIKALSQVLGLKAKFNYGITLIECDAKIHKVTEIKKKGDIPQEFHGRGGTSFIPVIEYINSHPRYRDAILIYFTDGYGDLSIPKPRVRQVVWVLTRGRYLSLRYPYGDVVPIDGDNVIGSKK